MNANSQSIPALSLRHLKAMLQVHRCCNLTQASVQLNRSQTAVTKAINELENNLGVHLFDRSATGMLATVHGTALAKRVEEAEAEFHAAGRAYLAYKRTENNYQNIPLFTMEISYKRLASFIALHDSRDVNAAANKLGVTKATIYNSVRQLEELLTLPLFERNPEGYTNTSFGGVLARHIKLAFAQIRHALDDIASLNGVTSGHVRIGTLPYTRTMLIPRAINRVLSSQPQLHIATQEGSYEQLETALRCGELDCIVGAIRPTDKSKHLSTETLFEDRLAIIVRKGHPLASRTKQTLQDLLEYPWVLPGANTPSRALFDQALLEYKLSTPAQVVETSSLSTVRGLLLESNRIALLSEHQIHYERQYGLLSTLPLALDKTYRPIGVTLRAQTQPSPATRLFLESLRQVAAELGQ